MSKHLGVSRYAYHAWLKRVPSNTEKRREAVKAKIKDIYDESKQNYGVPKITREFSREIFFAYDIVRCWGQKPHYSTLKILHKSLSFA